MAEKQRDRSGQAWRSSCWPSAAGSASPSPSWRAGRGCHWPRSMPSCRIAPALLRVARPPAGRGDAGHRHGRAGRHEPARAGVRADHAPARRHGALREGLRTPRAQGRARAHAAARRLLQPRPAQPSPARRRRDRRRPVMHRMARRATARSICGPSGSGWTTTRRTWRVPWPSSTAACSRPRPWRGGSLGFGRFARALPRPRRRPEPADLVRRLIDFQARTLILIQRTVTASSGSAGGQDD